MDQVGIGDGGGAGGGHKSGEKDYGCKPERAV